MTYYPFDCANCKDNCCDRRGKGSTQLFPQDHSFMVSESITDNQMPKKGGCGSCKFLSDDNLCSVYEKRPITCWTYPYSIDTNNNLYISPTCQDYLKIISGLVSGDADITAHVDHIYERMVNQLSGMTKKMMEDTIKGHKYQLMIRKGDTTGI